MAPITATGRPSPRCTPARAAWTGEVTLSKIPLPARDDPPEFPAPRGARRSLGASAGQRHGRRGGTTAQGTPRAKRSGGRGGSLEGPRGENAVDLLAVQRLALEEGPGQHVELLQVGVEQILGTRGRIHHDPLDLGVDQDRRLLAVVLRAGNLTAEEDVLLPLAKRERAHLVRH